MRVTIGAIRVPPVRALETEVVERKGRGHPDSICDSLAEELSRALCRWYVERFGAILHHNVDKVLLWGGAAHPEFGGGRILAPIHVYLAGRAILTYEGVSTPIDRLAIDSATTWLRGNIRRLDPEQHVRIHPLVRAGSIELAELFGRQELLGTRLANDTSIGVGFAPMTDLERLVAAVEARLGSAAMQERCPAIGEDIKVLGIRRGDRIALTIACAFLSRELTGLAAYLEAKAQVCDAALEVARTVIGRPVTVEVNTADDVERGKVYITVTGTSAEAGDDGQAGRGNRANGLITPYRPMTLESAAGKNPVTHVGKLYQIAAQRIADAVVAELDGVVAGECYLASRIGAPIDDPQLVDVKLELEAGRRGAVGGRAVTRIVERELARIALVWREVIEEAPVHS